MSTPTKSSNRVVVMALLGAVILGVGGFFFNALYLSSRRDMGKRVDKLEGSLRLERRVLRDKQALADKLKREKEAADRKLAEEKQKTLGKLAEEEKNVTARMAE